MAPIDKHSGFSTHPLDQDLRGQVLRRWWFRSGVGGQPGRQVVRAREVEQGHSCGEGCADGQGFQLTQGQGLDLGGGGVAERAAAAVELAEGDTACAAGVSWAAGFRGFTESRLVRRR